MIVPAQTCTYRPPQPPSPPPPPPPPVPEMPRRQCQPQPIGIRRSRSFAGYAPEQTAVVCDANCGECYEVPVLEYDPLSRKVADQISEHSRLVMNSK